MKRSRIGFWMLLILLVLGLLVTWAMGRFHEPIAGELEAAAEHALSGSWERATLLARFAREDWDKRQWFRAWFADHNPIEEIDADFARLEIWAEKDDALSFAAGCAELARKIRAMGEAHGLMLENIL